MKSTKARLEAAALFLVVFVLGVTFGALGEHIWNQRVSGEPAAINTNPTRNQVMEDMKQRLALTPDQERQIGIAVDDTRAKWKALYAPLDSQHEAIRQEGRAKMRAVLTPEQQVKFDDFLKRLDEQRRKQAEKQATH